jgi:hypothetical protein
MKKEKNNVKKIKKEKETNIHSMEKFIEKETKYSPRQKIYKRNKK